MGDAPRVLCTALGIALASSVTRAPTKTPPTSHSETITTLLLGAARPGAVLPGAASLPALLLLSDFNIGATASV